MKKIDSHFSSVFLAELLRSKKYPEEVSLEAPGGDQVPYVPHMAEPYFCKRSSKSIQK